MQSSKDAAVDGRFFGHSANDGGAGVPELLSAHLRRVADRAARFAAAFGAQEQGYAAGLLHDLGIRRPLSAPPPRPSRAGPRPLDRRGVCGAHNRDLCRPSLRAAHRFTQRPPRGKLDMFRLGGYVQTFMYAWLFSHRA